MAKKSARVLKKIAKPKQTKIKKEDEPCSFPTVGIGASAGGLETFSQLLEALPNNTGMAFVLIQHLDPTHNSLLTEVLKKTTQMRVQEITDGLQIKPNEVYVIPPGFDIGIFGGRFALFTRDKVSRKPHMAIDFFFRALAAECGNRAIGVVLSGTASDGTEGLRAIKSENGVTLVQNPKDAKYDGMPQSAVNAEVVDFCLTVPEIANELVRLANHPYLSGKLNEVLSKPTDDHELQKVFVLLRTAAGIDFSEYKPPTIKRRLARRMALLKINTLAEYIRLLQDTPAEIKDLASDVLIHVTSFFRDPDVFKKLQSKVFSEIIKGKALGTPIRVWVTGCASGEEVYSVAISLLEFLGERSSQFPIQMFGSDISERMIEKARLGFYSDSSVRGISTDLLKRFFVKVEGGFKICTMIRDLCVFVRHDLARDPPFSKLDLVTCRNVLIYFEQVLQKRIISTFHYCLNRPGFLLLGRTESILAHDQLFIAVDKTEKIFSRADVTSQLQFATMQNTPNKKQSFQSIALPSNRTGIDLGKQIDNLLLSEFAPAGVVINELMEVLQYRGKTGPFLEPPPGQPQLNILKMVREGLFAPLKLGIAQAKSKNTRVKKENLVFKHEGKTRACNVFITPVPGLTATHDSLFLILFQELPSPGKSKVHAPKSASGGKQKLHERNVEKRAVSIERELRATQEYLQSINEEHQKTNDTLNSVNEEFISGNEELQSMNEELETAKEELQSTNEELTTVNDELQNRSHETAQANDDLVNLLNGVEIPILILDINRKIRRFTPKARKIMNLLPSDVGRQIDDIKSNILIDDLDQQVQEVINTVHTQESEVQDRDGKWHRLQIRPYKTADHKIAGAVISLINIDLLRRAVIDAEWVRDYSKNIVEAVQIPLLVLTSELKIQSANQAFYSVFINSKSHVEGRCVFEVLLGKWNVDSLKKSLLEILANRTSFQNIEYDCEVPSLGTKVIAFSARSIQSHDGTVTILLSAEDVTDQKNRLKEKKELLKRAEAAQAESEKANLTKDLFLATLSHELRTPLTSMILQAQILQRPGLEDSKMKKAGLAIQRAAQVQTQLVEDLLDVSRIVTGKLKMDLREVNLNEVIRAALETVGALAESKSIILETHLDDSLEKVSGDSVRLQQVIWNLLTNAIKFTEKGAGENIVQVFSKEVNGRAQIRIVDMGIGIEQDFLPEVFNRFSQEQTTNTRSHGGLGLGLAIVRHLVELHGGTVRAESKGKNKGSTFIVSLPFSKDFKRDSHLMEGRNVPGTSREFKKTPGEKLSGLKILVVEDDPGVREALSEMLNLAGAEVREAACANEAIRVLKDFEPDELVLDIAMPIENGYSLLSRIRRLSPDGARKVPALALTALASERDREDALAAGFQMHLVKPVDMNRLTDAIFELSGRARIFH